MLLATVRATRSLAKYLVVQQQVLFPRLLWIGVDGEVVVRDGSPNARKLPVIQSALTIARPGPGRSPHSIDGWIGIGHLTEQLRPTNLSGGGQPSQLRLQWPRGLLSRSKGHWLKAGLASGAQSSPLLMRCQLSNRNSSLGHSNTKQSTTTAYM